MYFHDHFHFKLATAVYKHCCDTVCTKCTSECFTVHWWKLRKHSTCTFASYV